MSMSKHKLQGGKQEAKCLSSLVLKLSRRPETGEAGFWSAAAQKVGRAAGGYFGFRLCGFWLVYPLEAALSGL